MDLLVRHEYLQTILAAWSTMHVTYDALVDVDEVKAEMSGWPGNIA